MRVIEFKEKKGRKRHTRRILKLVVDENEINKKGRSVKLTHKKQERKRNKKT
jgi:hypothetical protein